LQIVSAIKTDTFSTTSTTFTDLTGLSIAITPSLASSNIMAVVSVTAGRAAGTRMLFRLLRDATPVGVGDAAGSRLQASFAVGDDGSAGMDTTGFNFVDSPATTSAVTYKIQGLIDSGTLYINRTATDTNSSTWGRCASTITLYEIGA